MTALWIALAGALGSLCRFGVARLLPPGLTHFPWATLIVNVLGSLAMGLAAARLAALGHLDTRFALALTTGFLGGFTTYSSFALDTVSILEKRNFFAALIYVLLTLVAALAACALGVALGRRVS